ncbi:tetratricopeptide repeat protein [Halotalea alkalilenta]|uniref:tetratricopeptide repeat protein n=1 Tax=Halotalea alkalilenta TaxID=376489 RepID=UPI0006939C99|nr:tetratricopeptide repeat protein [Halotalea alkalilenta]
MKRISRTSLLLALSLAFAPWPIQAAPATAGEAGLDAASLSALLEAEFALYSGDFGLAAQRYLSVGERYENLELIRRAGEIAQATGDSALLERVAEQWARQVDDGQAQPNPQESISMRRLLVDAAARRGDWEEALRQALVLDTAGETLQFEAMIESAAEQGADLDALDAQLAAHIEAQPDHPIPQVARALLTERRGQREAALAEIERLRERWPELPSVWLASSQIASRSAEPERALEDARHGQRLAPRDLRFNLAAVQTLIMLERFDEADREIKSLLEQPVDQDELRLAFARVYLQQEQPQRAEALLAPLAARVPTDGSVQSLLGLAAEQREDLDAAIERYRAVPAESESFLPSRARVAQLLQERRGIDAALAFLAAQRRAVPAQDAPLLDMSISLLDQAGRTNDADALLDRAVAARAPDNDPLLFIRAFRAIERRDAAGMERDLRTLLERHPDDPEVLNAYGYSLTELTDRYQEALGMLERAHALAPDNPAILDSLGWTHFRLDEPERALPLLERAHQLMPDDEIAAHLACVLIALDQRDRARELVERSLARPEPHPHIDALIESQPWLDSRSASESSPSSPGKGEPPR